MVKGLDPRNYTKHEKNLSLNSEPVHQQTRGTKMILNAISRRSITTILAVTVVSLVLAASRLLPSTSASDPGGTGDWPMWGGTADRNMVSNMKGLPTSWDVGKKVNVKWVAALGSQAYGNPVVAGGQVY